MIRANSVDTATAEPIRPLVVTEKQPGVGIYSPYDLLPGGGERYFLTIAEYLSKTHTVYLVLDEIYSKMRVLALGDQLRLDLSRINVVRYADVAPKLPFDIFLAVGNEIVPPVPALGTASYYLCQFPFPRADKVLVERRSNWHNYQAIFVYSDFVRGNVERTMTYNSLAPKPVIVLPPACIDSPEQIMDEQAKLAALAQQPQRVNILSVGRFFPGDHCKRHDVMIDALRDLQRLTRGASPVALHLAGSLHPTNDAREYYQKLLKQSEGLPVHFYLNAAIDELEALYRNAMFYWHAAGIDAHADVNPETMEHFGISVVEAMAHGCVPLVVNKGGPASIVEDGSSGLHYVSWQGLARKTAALIKDENRLVQLRRNALARATAFSKGSFVRSLEAALVVRA